MEEQNNKYISQNEIKQNNNQNIQDKNIFIKENSLIQNADGLERNNYSLFVQEGVGKKCKHCNKNYKIIKVKNGFEENKNIFLRDNKAKNIEEKEDEKKIEENEGVELKLHMKEEKFDKKDILGPVGKSLDIITGGNYKIQEKSNPNQQFPLKINGKTENINNLSKPEKENKYNEEKVIKENNSKEQNEEIKKKGFQYYNQGQQNKQFQNYHNNNPDEQQQFIIPSLKMNKGEIEENLTHKENNNENSKLIKEVYSEVPNINIQNSQERNRQQQHNYEKEYINILHKNNDKNHSLNKDNEYHQIINNSKGLKEFYSNNHNIPQTQHPIIKKGNIAQLKNHPRVQQSLKSNIQPPNNQAIQIQQYQKIKTQKDRSAISKKGPEEFIKKPMKLYSNYSPNLYSYNERIFPNALNAQHISYGTNSLPNESHELFEAYQEYNLKGAHFPNVLQGIKELNGQNDYDLNNKDIKFFPPGKKEDFFFIGEKNIVHKKANPVGNFINNNLYQQTEPKTSLRGTKSNNVINNTQKKLFQKNLTSTARNKKTKCVYKEYSGHKISLCPKCAIDESSNKTFSKSKDYKSQILRHNKAEYSSQKKKKKNKRVNRNYKYHEIIETSDNSKSYVMVKKGGVNVSSFQ